MKKTKSFILNYLNEPKEFLSKALENGQASVIADHFNLSRTAVSEYLNELHEEQQLIKINTRPVYFIGVHQLSQTKDIHCFSFYYNSLDDFKEDYERATKLNKTFTNFIGAQGSLLNCVEQCKAAITYPGSGLPILLLGATGSGKSFLATLLHQYAIDEKIIHESSNLVTINCSEYADNPELFLTNLFGYKKGSYTGAQKDQAGILAQANNGILFFDEIHSLKPECQEKIFLFLDKGVYHMIGDNEVWYSSNVRIIMATTENPHDALLSTFLRRVPIQVSIPALNERPLFEKRELIQLLYQKEEEKLNRNIELSQLAYRVLEEYIFEGNIGQLENAIKVSVACAINANHQDTTTVRIQIKDLPKYLMHEVTTNINLLQYDDEQFNKISHYIHFNALDDRYTILCQSIIHSYNQYSKHELSFDDLMSVNYLKLEQYVDYLYFKTNSILVKQEELLSNLLTNIITLLSTKYRINNFSTNKVRIIAKLINDFSQNYNHNKNFYEKNKQSVDDFILLLSQKYTFEYNTIQEILYLIKNNLKTNYTHLEALVLLIFMRYFNRDLKTPLIPVLILCHGYNIAKGIAKLANQVLHYQIFDSIDMPIDTHIELIAKQIVSYLKELEGCKEMIIMLDMGSIEDIYPYLNTIQNTNIGIINNVSTKLALDIGSMIIDNQPLEIILKESSTRNIQKYKVIKNKVKKNAILLVCSSGIATAEKIARLFDSSFPCKINVDLIPYDSGSFMTDEKQAILDKYNILFTIGTIDPNIDTIPFISIEQLIDQNKMDLLNSYLKEYLTEQQIIIFNRNIVKNFSLDNLLNYLTVLNPEKIINYIEDVILKIQKEMHMSFNSRITIGLYLHISCLIERLVINKSITEYANIEQFEKENQDFIAIIRKCFKTICAAYNVELVNNEIGYLYDYIYNAKDSVDYRRNSVEDDFDFLA